MASIRKRGRLWQAQVRRKDAPSRTRSFQQKSDAIAWARQVETDLDKSEIFGVRCQASTDTLADLLKRYEQDELPKKRGALQDGYRLRRLATLRFAQQPLVRLTAEQLAQYRDDRLQRVSTQTVRHELGLIQRVLNVAIREWGVSLPQDPIAAIRKPQMGRARERRLHPGEQEKLLSESARCRNPLIGPIIELAIETGMRRSELLNIRADHIDLNSRVLLIPVTKNGSPRTIPLTNRAISILGTLSAGRDGRLLSISGNAVQLAWQRLTKRAEIENLHFHDLRHEAISRFFEMGLSVPEVALISGHKDPRMLFRYTHLSAENIARKLLKHSHPAIVR